MDLNDLYICYPSIKKDPEKQFDHWLEKFSNYLDILLNRLLPDSPNIILCEDFTVKGKDNINSIVEKQVNIPFILFLVSPEFIARSDYMENLKLILTQIKNKTESLSSKVFKVLIAPTLQKSQPEFLHELVDYDLYDKELLSVTDELDQKGFRLEPNTPVWFKLVDLAYDVLDSVKSMRTEVSASVISEPGKRVFLAETTGDQEMNRDSLKRELMQFGYRILPASPISVSPKQAEKVITESVKYSELAIHIVGNDYGELMENSDTSMVEFQIDQVSKTISSNGFKQIIWFPPDLKPISEQQQLFIEKLKRLELLGKSVEIVQTPVEILKTLIKKKLTFEFEDEEKTAKTKLLDKPFVYLIHEKKDVNEIKTILSWFEKSDIQLVTSEAIVIEKNPVTLHRNYLVHCQGVMIYYSGDNWPWINSKLMDLLKSPGYGREKPLKAKALVVKGEYDNLAFKAKDIDIIEIKNGSPSESFNFFREKLNQ
jgi:hypothetical protein